MVDTRKSSFAEKEVVNESEVFRICFRFVRQFDTSDSFQNEQEHDCTPSCSDRSKKSSENSGARRFRHDGIFGRENTKFSVPISDPSTMATFTAFRQALAASSLRRNASIIMGISSMTTPVVALCEEKSFMDKIVAKDRSGNIDWNASMDHVAAEAGKSVQGAIDSGYPTQLSYGFVMGYCSGYALKKAGKVAAVILGESPSDWRAEIEKMACMREIGTVGHDFLP